MGVSLYEMLTGVLRPFTASDPMEWVHGHQDRIGPERVGPFGLLQTIADGIKLFMKEDLVPAQADKVVFILAPAITVVTALVATTVIPWGDTMQIFGRTVTLYIADVNVAVLVVLRDRLDGRLRHRARRLELEQQVLAARRPALVGADDQLRAVVRASALASVLLIGELAVAGRHRQRPGGHVVRRHPALVRRSCSRSGFFIFMIAGVAETNRAPFDFPGGGAGAGRRLPHRVQQHELRDVLPRRSTSTWSTVSAVATDLFLGGWHGPVPARLARLDLVPAQGRRDPVLLRLDALDAAALPLRPADGVRLEGAAAGSRSSTCS